MKAKILRNCIAKGLPLLLASIAIVAMGIACTAEEKEPVIFADLNWDSAEIQDTHRRIHLREWVRIPSREHRN